MKPTRGIFGGICAPTASGQAAEEAVALPKSAMKSRRFIFAMPPLAWKQPNTAIVITFRTKSHALQGQCPKWVKTGKAQCEQMFSALTLPAQPVDATQALN